MTDWKAVLLHFATDVEGHFDKLKNRLEERLGRGPICIIPYMGYATQNTLHLKGRVLENKGITPAGDADSIWQNLHNMYKRMNSDEIPHARVRARFGEIEQEVTADEEGHFTVQLESPTALPEDQRWFEVELELIDYPSQKEPKEAAAVGRVLRPPSNAQFGVISDIDDTVLQTNVLDLLAMARNVFLHNAHTRLPFEGVAAFYRALQKGTQDTFNPIFYLSSSPWNLYDLLVDFFQMREIPLGPLFLVNLGLTETQLVSPSHKAHKAARITTLLNTYSQLPFILIGDSSQKDPEIYLQAAIENPGRILTIYIRDVTGEGRDAEVMQMAEKAAEVGTSLLLVPDTAGATQHAIEHGYMLAEERAEIAAERAQDKAQPSTVEQLLNAATGSESSV